MSASERDEVVAAAGGTGLLWVGLLGPLVVRRGPVVVDVAAPMPRALLGLLALHTGQRVSRDEIVEVLWGDDPPGSAVEQVRVHVARLRALLEPDRPTLGPGSVIVRSRDGYALGDRVRLDVSQFDDLVATARSSTDPDAAFGAWAQALEIWRGLVAVDAGSRLRQHPLAVAAARRRLDAAAAFADAGLGLLRYDRVLPVVRDAVAGEPLHEGLHARLMLALAGAGEQAAALAVFTDLRERLADELGVEPGAEVRTAHLRVLRHDLSDAPAAVTPAQLPLDVYGFTGRSPELAQLDAVLARSGEQPTAVVISAVWGTAGVGKTALAVHWARPASPGSHRCKSRRCLPS